DYGCPEHDPKHRCFREFVEIATITGLSVESKFVKPGSKSGKSTDGLATEGAAAKGSGSAPSPSGSGSGGGGGAGKGSPEYSRFCFDLVLAERGTRAMQPDRLRVLRAQYIDNVPRSPVCGSPWTPGQGEDEGTDTLVFHVGPVVFKILPRSTNSIYQFLGKVLKEQIRAKHEEATEGERELRAYLPRWDERLPVLTTTRDDPNLLSIVPATGQECFVHTWFIDGDYCVPERGSSNTKRIFSLLA